MVRFLGHGVPRSEESSTAHNLSKATLVLLEKKRKEKKTRRRDTRVGQQLIVY